MSNFEPGSHAQLPIVLVADDDPDDRELMREAFEATHLVGGLHFVGDGVELMDYLHQRDRFADPSVAPRPDLLLLDLNMPRKDGREALKEIKSSEALQTLRVVILTTSRSRDDIQASYLLSATSYITKPASYRGLMDVVDVIAKYWLRFVELPSLQGDTRAG